MAPIATDEKDHYHQQNVTYLIERAFSTISMWSYMDIHVFDIRIQNASDINSIVYFWRSCNLTVLI